MADIIYTDEIDEAWMHSQTPDIVAQVYNGLDCCVTYEIRDVLKKEIANDEPCVRETYDFSLRKLGPVLDMELRGIKVDFSARNSTIDRLKKQLEFIQANFDALCLAAFDTKINWRSPLQMKTLFYGSFGLREVRRRNTKGIMAPTVDRGALESFRFHFLPQIFANHVLAMRDIGKKIGFLETEIDSDGRLRTSYNVAGTKTGRLASSASVFGSGTNNQNIDTELRYPFVADKGKILINIDLEQADARNVGALIWNIFVDEIGEKEAGKYLDACESGDLHTTVCSMAWQDLEWPSPWDLKEAKFVAGQNFYRDMSYRDAAKRLGHGTNFTGYPATMAKHTQTAQGVIEIFQQNYFAAFPLIGSYDRDPEKMNWHTWTLNQLKTRGSLTTPFGRRRFFFDRWQNPSMLREAIAYCPQSMTAHQIDMGYIQLFENLREIELLAQVHDSILLQIPFAKLDALMPKIMALMEFPFPLKRDRILSVPLEAKVGWNWGDVKYNRQGAVIGNHHGLKEWTGKETRTPPKPATRLSDYL